MINQVFVTHPNTLLVHCDAPVGKVRHNAMEEIVHICHGFPWPKGHIHLTMVLKKLGLPFTPLKTEGVEKWALVGRDGHLFFEDADL